VRFFWPAAFVVLQANALAQPFSHRLHLKLNLTCISCHATAQTSTRIEDNNLPPQATCLKCHKQAIIKSPAKTLLARFDHQKHLRLGNVAPVIAAAIDSKAYLSSADDIRRHLNSKNACAACHRGMEESNAVTRSALPQMADCLVCHSHVEPPFSCEICHAKDAQLKPATHTPDFLDSHTRKTAKLDKPSCAVCHGRKFNCLGCH
jgi:hypothetical protein